MRRVLLLLALLGAIGLRAETDPNPYAPPALIPPEVYGTQYPSLTNPAQDYIFDQVVAAVDEERKEWRALIGMGITSLALGGHTFQIWDHSGFPLSWKLSALSGALLMAAPTALMATARVFFPVLSRVRASKRMRLLTPSQRDDLLQQPAAAKPPQWDAACEKMLNRLVRDANH